MGHIRPEFFGGDTAKQSPLISIITPSFNQRKFIERTILSVLSQNYPNLEYWVIDGGSTDGTVEILKKYDNRLKWISEPDKGQTDAINKGLRRAKGEILAYLNSDDTYLPNALETVGNYFTRYQEVNVFVGKGQLIDMNDNYLGDYHNSQMDFSKPQPTCSICQPAVFWKQEVLKRCGYFDESYHYAMDYEYWVRISKKHRLHYIDTFLAASRIHAGTKTSLGQLEMTKDIVAAQHQHYKRVHERWLLNLVYLENKSPYAKITDFFHLSLTENGKLPSVSSILTLARILA